MSTSSSRRLFLKGAAAIGIAGALGTGQLAMQGAQAATLDIQNIPLDLRVNQATIDISGFTLSYEVSGLLPIFENGLYTPYFEIGNYTRDKGFKVFYFISLEKNRMDTDNVYRQTVILPTDMTTGPEGKFGIRLTLRPYNKQYTILRTMVSDVTVNTDYAQTPFIIDLNDEDPYAYDVYTVCQQKMMLIDKDRRIYPYRMATRGDLMDTLYRTVGSPKVSLPAVSPYPDVSPHDPRYSAYIWAVQKGLTSGCPTVRCIRRRWLTARRWPLSCIVSTRCTRFMLEGLPPLLWCRRICIRGLRSLGSLYGCILARTSIRILRIRARISSLITRLLVQNGRAH